MTANISSSTHDRQPVKNGTSPIEGESPELVDVLQKIVHDAGALLEIDHCSVALLDTDRTMLVTLAAFQKQGSKAVDSYIRKNKGVAVWVVEHRETLIIDDVGLDPRFKSLAEIPVGSLVCMPLIDKDNLIGTLTASSGATGHFSPPRLRMLTHFVEQAVLLITSTRRAELAQQDAARMKASFLSLITHELRSPINAINGYLDLVLAGISGGLNQQQREFVQRARAGSEHLYALVEDVLLISRADSGQLRLNYDVINLHDIIAAAVEELELIAHDNGITVTPDVASDFLSIDADPVRIQQVLRNLISNALRFTSSGGHVTISARLVNKGSETASPASTNQHGQLVEIQVRDTGCGIAPEHQQRIFERFYQVPLASAGRSSGQGLGLTIVKMVVELHGGQVTVQSNPGEGSTFCFTLPTLKP